jgi:hypothetical protein
MIRVHSLAIKVIEFVRLETSQFSVGNSHGKFVVEEEYKKSACEDVTRDLKTFCVL